MRTRLRPTARLVVAAAVGLGAVLAVAPVHAEPSDPFAWLDADAPVVLSVAPAGVAPLARAIGLDAAAPFGLRLEDGDWSALGVDESRPFTASLGAIRAAETATLFERLADARVWNDQLFRNLRKTYWRSRIVVPVGNADRARTVATRAAATSGFLLSVADDEARSIAMVFGGHPKRADDAVRALRARGVVAIGWEPASRLLVAVRLPDPGSVLIIDVLRPFAGVPIVWERNRREVFALLDRAPGDGRLARRLEPAPAAWDDSDDAAARPTARVWLRAGPTLAAIDALARRQILFRVAAAGRDRPRRREHVAQGREQLSACGRFSSLAGRGALRTLALELSASADHVAIAVRGARRDGKARVPPARDDGLWSRLAGAQWAVSLETASASAIRGAPRPDVLRAGDALSLDAATCGAGATLATLAFAGPALAGLALDELAARKPVGRVFNKARNAAWFEAADGRGAMVTLPRGLRRRARRLGRSDPGARALTVPGGPALAVGDAAALDWLDARSPGRGSPRADDDPTADDATEDTERASAAGDAGQAADGSGGDDDEPAAAADAGHPGDDDAGAATTDDAPIRGTEPSKAGAVPRGTGPLVRFAVTSRAAAPPWLAALLAPVWPRVSAIAGSIELGHELRGGVRVSLRPR